jgi:tetratricopeptide (TPR) repeat protein
VRNIIFIISLLLSISAIAQQKNTDQIFQDANQHYSQAEYGEALSDYQLLLGEGVASSELYYNIGNTEYNLGHIGKAILYYERAKLLAPNNKSINTNLNIAREKVESDILEIPDFLPVRLWQGMAKSLSPGMWIVFQAIMGCLLLYGIFLFYNNTERSQKIKSIVIALIGLSMLLITYSAGKTSHNLIHLHDKGIVMGSSTMYSAPDSRSEEIVSLADGVKVNIIDNIDSWYQVELMNRSIGWIEMRTVERI